MTSTKKTSQKDIDKAEFDLALVDDEESVSSRTFPNDVFVLVVEILTQRHNAELNGAFGRT